MAGILAVVTAMTWFVRRPNVPDDEGGDEQSVLVEVRGEVPQPGFHPIAPPVTVDSVVRAAGGALEIADPRPVPSGVRVEVRKGVASFAPITDPLVIGLPVDINAADVDTLVALPGVGAVRAAAIVEDRTANGPFGSIDELARVHGIGPATVEQLRAFVEVRSDP